MTTNVDNAMKDENQTLPADQVEEEFKTPEDEAYEEAQRNLAEAERAAAEEADKGDEDKAETAEFEEVAEEAIPEDDAPADGENFDKSDDDKGKTVPLGALVKVRKEGTEKVRALELQLARMEGELNAQKRSPAEEDEADVVSPEEQMQALEEQIDQAWKDADDGEMTLSQTHQKVREIEKQIQDIKQQSALPIQDPQTVVMDAQIETNLVELETKYPVISTLDEQQMQGFVQRAYQQAEEEGKPIGSGALETMRLHNMAAKSAHEHFAQFYRPAPTKQADKPTKELSPAGQTPGKTGLSPQAQARADKMDLAATHPPDINQIGSAAEGTLNDDQILAKMQGMSEEDKIEFLDAMPGLAQRLGAV